MITENNIEEILNTLTIGEIWDDLARDGDYINVIVSVFNAGYTVELESVDTPDQKVIDNGNLSLDKDDFVRLLNEYNINH